jgi:hypothetical protein
VNLRKQPGYYTTFFWGPDGAFTSLSYYGAHPYPDGEPRNTSDQHSWEVSIAGLDVVKSLLGQSTAVQYGSWKRQAFRAYDDGKNKIHEFYYDLPDTTRVIRVVQERSYGAAPPLNPALTFGDAPWSIARERLSGILRGIQIYSANLTPKEILSEAAAPRATAAGNAGMWYLNLDPTPADIADKSGQGHHPSWSTSARPKEWQESGVSLNRHIIRHINHNHRSVGPVNSLGRRASPAKSQFLMIP